MQGYLRNGVSTLFWAGPAIESGRQRETEEIMVFAVDPAL